MIYGRARTLFERHPSGPTPLVLPDIKCIPLIVIRISQSISGYAGHGSVSHWVRVFRRAFRNRGHASLDCRDELWGCRRGRAPTKDAHSRRWGRSGFSGGRTEKTKTLFRKIAAGGNVAAAIDAVSTESAADTSTTSTAKCITTDTGYG